jgi:hypothetical protein
MKPTTRIAAALVLIVSLFCAQLSPAAPQTHKHPPDTRVYTQDDSGREDKPEVVIEAPTTVKVGDMIVIDLSKSLGGGFDMIVKPTLPSARVFDEGKVIVSGTGYKTQEYLVIVSCALNGQSDVKTHTIRVIGPQPMTPVNPGENIAGKVSDWCEAVDSPTPRDDALKLAQSFASLASVIENNTFETPREIITATKTSNRDALGTNLDHWIPLLDGLMNELKAMEAAGMLPDAQAHGPVWRAVSEGLTAYAAQLAG